MGRLIILTSALLMISSAASEFTREQSDVIAVAALAQLSGLNETAAQTAERHTTGSLGDPFRAVQRKRKLQ